MEATEQKPLVLPSEYLDILQEKTPLLLVGIYPAVSTNGGNEGTVEIKAATHDHFVAHLFKLYLDGDIDKQALINMRDELAGYAKDIVTIKMDELIDQFNETLKNPQG